ncbi:DUF1304 domain-containing protein [Flavicella sediminum]|uniref:DUF1304 domain-containing protein n=1 Tax=Flavicella sediminum TaxID=2585141 RepID=UPI001121A4AD|nr:DUF1304 domain-containing protein [Flavicella sediminum]
MKTWLLISIGIVALIHFYFMLLEMVLWTKPIALKAFGFKKEFAEKTKVLAANQGLYNGFLVAGLLWSMLEINNNIQLSYFFLGCVIIAGIYGSISLKSSKVLFIQSGPAIIALLLTQLLN